MDKETKTCYNLFMLDIKETIIVEGKFDKERVKRVCSAPIICTDGFEIFRSKRMLDNIRNLAETTGIIVLTDSDRAGFKIRNHIKTCVGERGVVKHAYIPSLHGKEKRKDKPGKEGLLGVEGMDDSVLIEAIKKVSTPAVATVQKLTKAEMYSDGLTGHADSQNLRQRVLAGMKLPVRLSPNAMIELINKAGLYDEYKKALKSEVDKNG